MKIYILILNLKKKSKKSKVFEEEIVEEKHKKK